MAEMFAAYYASSCRDKSPVPALGAGRSPKAQALQEDLIRRSSSMSSEMLRPVFWTGDKHLHYWSGYSEPVRFIPKRATTR